MPAPPTPPPTQKTVYDDLNVSLFLLLFPCFLTIFGGPAHGFFAWAAWLVFLPLNLYLLICLAALIPVFLQPAERPGFFSTHKLSLAGVALALFFILRVNLYFAPFPAVRTAIHSATFGLIHNPAEGTFTATGPSIGSWTEHVDSCSSGQTNLYFGASLRDTTQPNLRIRIVGSGPDAKLKIDAPSQNYAVVFTAADCTPFDIKIHQGASTYNGTRNVVGTVAFACGSDQSKIQGQATLHNCH